MRDILTFKELIEVVDKIDKKMSLPGKTSEQNFYHKRLPEPDQQYIRTDAYRAEFFNYGVEQMSRVFDIDEKICNAVYDASQKASNTPHMIGIICQQLNITLISTSDGENVAKEIDKIIRKATNVKRITTEKRESLIRTAFADIDQDAVTEMFRYMTNKYFDKKFKLMDGSVTIHLMLSEILKHYIDSNSGRYYIDQYTHDIKRIMNEMAIIALTKSISVSFGR